MLLRESVTIDGAACNGSGLVPPWLITERKGLLWWKSVGRCVIRSASTPQRNLSSLPGEERCQHSSTLAIHCGEFIAWRVTILICGHSRCWCRAQHCVRTERTSSTENGQRREDREHLLVVHRLITAGEVERVNVNVCLCVICDTNESLQIRRSFLQRSVHARVASAVRPAGAAARTASRNPELDCGNKQTRQDAAAGQYHRGDSPTFAAHGAAPTQRCIMRTRAAVTLHAPLSSCHPRFKPCPSRCPSRCQPAQPTLVRARCRQRSAHPPLMGAMALAGPRCWPSWRPLCRSRRAALLTRPSSKGSLRWV